MNYSRLFYMDLPLFILEEPSLERKLTMRTISNYRPELNQATRLFFMILFLVCGSASAEQLLPPSEALDSDGDGILDEADLDDDNDGILDSDENIDKNASWDFETPVVGSGNNFFGANFQNWTLSAGSGQINLIHPPYPNSVPQVPSRGEQYVEISGDATFSRPYSITRATPITLQIDFSPWSFRREETRIQIIAADGITVLAESPVIVTEANTNTNWSDRDEIWQTAEVKANLEPGDYFFRFRLGNYQAFDNVRVSTQNAADDDQDGIPNSLDTDSDNDGCPDAIEGSAIISWPDLNPSALSGEVDENGIPVRVGPGGQKQSVSVDPAVLDPNCNDPKPEIEPDPEPDPDPEPEPVITDLPQASSVSIYDDDGDGIADSLWMDFDKSLNQQNRFDSASVIWGGDTTVYRWADFNKSQDMRFLHLSDQSFSQDTYTGSHQTALTHQILLFYSDTTAVNGQPLVAKYWLKDRVGPVIVLATLIEGDEQTLIVEYSEKVAYDFDEDTSDAMVYQFKVESDEIQEYPISKFKLLSDKMSSVSNQAGNLIHVRDSIRLSSERGIQDLDGNRPHPQNILREFIVQAQIKVKKSHFAFVQAVNEFGEEASQDQFGIYHVDEETPAEEIPSIVNALGAKYTLDLASEFQKIEDLDESLIRVRWQMEVFTNLGGFVGQESGSLDCDDPIFDRGCLNDKSIIYPGWNMRNKSGRLSGSGAYIMRVRIKLIYNGEEHSENEEMWIVGVRR